MALFVTGGLAAIGCLTGRCAYITPVPCSANGVYASEAWYFEGRDPSAMAFMGDGLTIVSAWNPGEHVLQIPAHRIATANVDLTIQAVAGIGLDLLVRCDPGASIALTANSSTVSQSIANADGTWSHQSLVIEPSSGPIYCLAQTHTSTISTVAFRVSGTGNCQIDNVAIGGASWDCSHAVAPCGNTCYDAGAPDATNATGDR
jgi:hypothetical protein